MHVFVSESMVPGLPKCIVTISMGFLINRECVPICICDDCNALSY